MIFGSLFSGIGGLDLGLERSGMRCAWQVENDPYCQRVLAKHWPDVPRYGDIHEVTELPNVDLICGGFPCQPVSVAGKRLAQDDQRWLWPEFARVVRMVRPRYVLVENVPGLLVRGFGDVLRDLAELGHDAEWGVLSAADVGAPHLRKRVFLVAASGGVSDTERDGVRIEWERDGEQRIEPGQAQPADDGTARSLAYSVSNRLEGLQQDWATTRPTLRSGSEMAYPDRGRRQVSRVTEPPGIESARGSELDRRGPLWKQQHTSTVSWWDVEPAVGRVAARLPGHVDRLKALGNAVVPQVAQWIGERIMEANR